jgi:hypothetical protein
MRFLQPFLATLLLLDNTINLNKSWYERSTLKVDSGDPYQGTALNIRTL